MARAPLQSVCVLRWFRPNQTADLLKTWAIGSALALTGLIIGGLRFWPATPLSEAGKAAALVGGLLVSLFGLMWAVLRALRALRDETCLLIRSDGVELQPPAPAAARFIAWHDVASIQLDPSRARLSVYSSAQEPPLSIDASFVPDLPDLRRLLESTQRRALMGLIKSQVGQPVGRAGVGDGGARA